jgi:hypothetical protein
MTLIHTEIREEVEAVDREAGAVGSSFGAISCKYYY